MTKQSPITRVLVVDDSSLIRLIVADIVEQQDDMQVCGTASNGQEAFEQCLALRPDIVLLDMLMPETDGLFAINAIMGDCPTPILVLSALNSQESAMVFEAINAGAAAFISKPSAGSTGKLRRASDELVEKIRAIARKEHKLPAAHQRSTVLGGVAHTFSDQLVYQAVVLGASTGGPQAVEYFIRNLPVNFPLPIIVAQHIPMSFVGQFAQRISTGISNKVFIATDQMLVENHCVYFLPTDQNMELVRNAQGKVIFQTTSKSFAAFNCPSVDALFLSAGHVWANKCIALLFSGMGKDGAQGMESLFQLGAMTIVQDEQTSVVFGMPGAAVQKKAVRFVLPLQEISTFVVRCLD